MRQPGERIFYTGDVCNVSDYGTITALRAPAHVDITLDDGRIILGVPTDGIGEEYHGHCNPRFVTAVAVQRWRQTDLEETAAWAMWVIGPH